MAAIGRSAAATELAAFAMPAPQVLVVQRHCTTWKSSSFTGTWQVGMFGSSAIVVGKGRAPSRRRASICAVERFALRESMSAAIPETIGAEKLVPRLVLVWFVKMWLAGTVVPLFEVVSSENRQGPPLMLTQLPPGAATVTSGPRLLNPTLLPAWRIAAMAATPGQFPGDETIVPSLPAETTSRTFRALSSSDDIEIGRLRRRRRCPGSRSGCAPASGCRERQARAGRPPSACRRVRRCRRRRTCRARAPAG